MDSLANTPQAHNQLAYFLTVRFMWAFNAEFFTC